MNERALQAKHEIPIQRVDDASMRSLYWSLGGLVAMGTGIGVAAAVQDQSGTAAAIAGISGLALGLVGVVGALASQPSGPDQLDAEARRSLLIRGEDDMHAAARGVNHANDQRRQQCGGPPSPPFVLPAPQTQPPTSPSAPPEAPPSAPVGDAPAPSPSSPAHAP